MNMNVDFDPQLDIVLGDFYDAQTVANESWEAAVAGEEDITPLETQVRAIGLGLMAAVILLESSRVQLIESAPTQAETPKDNSERKLYTSPQAAEKIGVSLATIRRWSDKGEIETKRTPGGQRRFTAEALDAFVEQM